MQKIIAQLKAFVQLYPLWYWVCILLFCACSVYLNYTGQIQGRIDQLYSWQEYFAYVALYASHSFFALWLYSLVSKNYTFWRNLPFMVLLFAGFCIFAFRAVTWEQALLIEKLSSAEHRYLNRLVFNDVFRFLYLVLPVTVLWFLHDRKLMPVYGFTRIGHQQKVYWYLLLCMIPLIAGASMLGDFLDYYPRLRKINNANGSMFDSLFYELFYGLDFVSIEYFFRGFMVMAFIRYIGPHAIVPMAVFYMSIHYGKPMGEAISSFFGGSILGVLAFHSRSIYGGIMVHMGIAWLMELGGFLGNYWRGTW